MTPDALRLLVELAIVGGELQAHGDRLRVRPRVDQLLPRIMDHKPVILALIGDRGGIVTAHDLAVAALPPDARADYEERAAIMEYDAGMDRPTAERKALRDTFKRHWHNATSGDTIRE